MEYKNKYVKTFENYFSSKNVNESKDELIDYTIPEWALSALINGDESGLNDEEQEKLDMFCKKVADEFGNASFMLGDDDDDLGFKHSNDIDNLGSNCTTLYIKPSKKADDDNAVTEATNKTSTRDEMMDLISKKFPNIWMKKSEDFKKDDNNRGIWTGAEGSTFIDDAKKVLAFNPVGAYSYDKSIAKNYVNEVHKTLAKFLKEHGWYAEFYDDATVFFYPIWSSDDAKEKFIEQGKKDGFIVDDKVTESVKEDNILGKTQSGKNIYSVYDSYPADYDKQDYKDAAAAHSKAAKKAKDAKMKEKHLSYASAFLQLASTMSMVDSIKKD